MYRRRGCKPPLKEALVLVPHKSFHGNFGTTMTDVDKWAANVDKMGGNQTQNGFHPLDLEYRTQRHRRRRTADLASLPCSTGKA